MTQDTHPSFLYTMSTGDHRWRTIEYVPYAGDYRAVRDTGWMVGEPTMETTHAEVVTRYPDGTENTLTLDGDQHRELEMSDRLIALFEAIRSGDEPEIALQDALAGASRLAMAG